MSTRLDAIRKLFTSPYVLHMEREIEYLRGHNAQLLLELKTALIPPAPVSVKRELPKYIPPVKTSWEAYLAEEIRKQEAEDGTHSSGRQ